MKTKINTKETGSFFNLLMGNNSSVPEIGKGATILHWTDRSAYEVIAVDEASRTCTIQRYKPTRVDNLGMSESQRYEYKELTDEVINLVYRQGAWRSIERSIIFTEDYKGTLTDEQRQEIFQGELYAQKVVAGITRQRVTYRKVNIIFGVKMEYYDFSF